jgi:hypothetical protein
VVAAARVQEFHTVCASGGRPLVCACSCERCTTAPCCRANYTSGIINTHTHIVNTEEEASVDATDQLINLRNQCEVSLNRNLHPFWTKHAC